MLLILFNIWKFLSLFLQIKFHLRTVRPSQSYRDRLFASYTDAVFTHSIIYVFFAVSKNICPKAKKMFNWMSEYFIRAVINKFGLGYRICTPLKFYFWIAIAFWLYTSLIISLSGFLQMPKTSIVYCCPLFPHGQLYFTVHTDVFTFVTVFIATEQNKYKNL